MSSDHQIFLGLDVGTTSCKCAFLDATGSVLAEAAAEYPLATLSSTEIEQNAENWWRGACRTVSAAARAARIEPEAVAAVAVSSQGISFVPVDDSGGPLRNAISWLDSRAREETKEILGALPAEQLFALTGKRGSAFYTLPKILWLREREPHAFAAAHKLLLAHDYVVHRLTGRAITDQALASGTLMHDVSRRVWSREILGRFDISEALLPELAEAGSTAGQVHAQASADIGLKTGTRVAVGSQDQKCAAYAAGARQGIATASLGTATAVSAVVGKPLFDPQMRIPCFPYPASDLWILEGVVSTSGAAVQWFRDAIYGGEFEPMDAAAEAEMTATRSLFFFPHLAGAGSPVWSAPHGGAFTGLSLHTTPAAMARAVLEGAAYQIRSNLDVLRDMEVSIETLRLFGGGARSRVWTRIIADVTGIPVFVSRNPESAAVGACLLAARSAGEGIRLCQDGQTIEPHAAEAQEYSERYARYREVEALLCASS